VFGACWSVEVEGWVCGGGRRSGVVAEEGKDIFDI
jgi:hypothetical protein